MCMLKFEMHWSSSTLLFIDKETESQVSSLCQTTQMYIRVARTKTLIWMFCLVYFHCLWKEDMQIKCPGITFLQIGHRLSTHRPNQFLLTHQSLLTSLLIHLRFHYNPSPVNSWTSLGPLSQSTTLSEFNHPLAPFLHPNSWAKLEKNHSAL